MDKVRENNVYNVKVLFVKILNICVLSTFINMAAGQQFVLNVDSISTTYRLHLPKGYSPTKKYPLVVNFHGLGADAMDHEYYCQMDKVADKEGFIVVYPQSNHKGWNVGYGLRSYTDGPDDIRYFNLLLDTLERDFSIDKNRIYSTGVSLGGSLSYRVACDMSIRVAAIASVSGLMTDSTYTHCNPIRHVPILHIHGTRDHLMRYKGMDQTFSAEETVKLWAFKNKCENKPDTIQIPNRNKSDHTTAMLIKYLNCESGSEVWFYKIIKGGHTWPGAAKQFKLMGKKNKDFNGSEAIWEFFERFTLQTGVRVHSNVE